MNKTSKKQQETFFEYCTFQSYRNASLQNITYSKIHEKYKEIREIMDLIKDYKSNPEQISELDKHLNTIETPPITPIKTKNASKNPTINPEMSFLTPSKPTYSSHHASILESPFPMNFSKDFGNKETSDKKINNDTLKLMMNMLQNHLSQNLKETQELKDIILKNQGKAVNSINKSSLLDVLNYDSPNDRKISESSFGKGPLETGEGLVSPGRKKIENEISQAERKVYELQNQRFQNKIQELTKKNENFNKEIKEIEEKMKDFKEFINKQTHLFGNIGISKKFLKENFSTMDIILTTNAEYKEVILLINKDGFAFYRDNDFSDLEMPLIPWHFIKDISIYEKDDKPLNGYYVLKFQESENQENNYIILKINDEMQILWENFFLSCKLRTYFKNSEVQKYLRRDGLEKLLSQKEEIKNNPIYSNNSSPKVMNRIYDIKQRKSLKNSAFHQIAQMQCNSPVKKREKKERHLPTVSSKSLQPARETGSSLQKFSDKNKYKSTFDLKCHPYGLTLNDSLQMKSITEFMNKRLKALTLMKNGFVFLKYGKYGDPHERLLLLSCCEKKLEWRPINKKSISFLELSQIKDIKEGRNSTIFLKYKSKNSEQTILSFSIYYGNKTLDLEANSLENKESFIWSLNILKKKNNCMPLDNGQRVITDEVVGHDKTFNSKNFSLMDRDEAFENC